MSEILATYRALANLQLGGVKGKALEDVSLDVADADLPQRIILPMPKGDGEFVAIGSLRKVIWSIRDLCLWSPIHAGGIDRFAAPMVRYIESYLVALAANRGIGAQSHVSGFAFQITPIAWGEGQYYAVDVTLTVEELL